ncbi:MAG TPA: TIGR01777 family oxidoreductase [Syntrophales bacterium]|nr:TIGR01777 family oxidoreductase [Syntrophales bacterium]HOM08020.1 TIGR01777 family oxidoreductase [Syntrophales bacterium]HOO00690.1 TIGR01777 family oxidoreductase [Syntrophales bacterium]HPC01933.1 TIGR01777 family oxidoreductase [Syntrophales bacterium]HPQ07446.1 TIGR01777 family oxidoreductase [Syntrophales bacterium]
MKIFMTGGTGFVGTTLTRTLLGAGHGVTILTRPGEKPRALAEGAAVVVGDPARRGPWQEEAARHDVVVNLAGASIFSRWTEARKKEIRESRILTTRHVVEALGEGKRLLSTSAVGFYGPRGDEEVTEADPPGDDFLASLAAEWEREALRAADRGAGVVLLRFGIVLGRNGGALSQLVPLFRLWAGSPLGSGRQWFSWIHERDLAEIYLFLLGRPDISGPVNCTAPGGVTNEEFTFRLGKALGVPTFLPAVPAFVLKAVLGEFAGALLTGQRVVPKRLTEAGFSFLFPTLGEALADLVA